MTREYNGMPVFYWNGINNNGKNGINKIGMSFIAKGMSVHSKSYKKTCT